MVCPTCRKAVPDESAFCLACGARLVQAARGAPVNGGTAPAPEPAPSATPPPTGKQPYTLSFRPVADERLRYRLARWVCERAPAHAIGEVQESLQRGDFLTFLALTADEAETVRQAIQGLGVAPTLVSFAPGTAPALFLPGRRPAKPAKEARGMKGKEWAALGLAVVMLFVFGLVVIRLFGGRGF